MNSSQAKKLSIPDLMGRWGHQPVKVRHNGNELWYKSPFRAEKDASFITSFLGGKWIWNDFGDIGGTIIDLVMRKEGYNRVSQALTYLDKEFTTGAVSRVGESNSKQFSHFYFKQQSRQSAQSTDENLPLQKSSLDELELKLVGVKPVTNPVIFSYLTKERCIDKKLVEKYLLEISYDNLTMKKRFFAFGIKNDSDGYEIRSASDKFSFKSSLNSKDITTIKGTGVEPNKVNIFEGMTDFLSLLTHYKRDSLPSDTIIMNSTNANLPKTISAIKSENYNIINTFFDNDKTGIKTFNSIKEEFPNTTFSQSHLFAPYTDFNDMLKATLSVTPRKI